MTQVLVLPHAKVPANSPHDGGAMAVRKALLRRWPTDAHMTLYNAPQRLLKADLPEGLRITLTALDYDLEDHRNAKADESTLAAALGVDPRPTHAYLTRGGARLLYEHDPITPTEAEALHQALVDRLASQGFVCDPNCWQWTRLFRLPRVVRDGAPLDPPVRVDCGPPLPLDGFDLSAPPRSFAVPSLRLPMPDLQAAKGLVWEFGSRSLKLSTWAREAQRRLRFRMDGELDRCFEKDPPPLPDPRNDTLIRLIGSASALLYGEIETTPEHIFGLLLERTQQSVRHTDGNRNLVAECWKIVLYCWAQEKGRTAHQAEVREEVIERLGPDVLDRLVVRTSRGTYYVLQDSGRYSSIAQIRDSLPGALLRSGLVPALTPLTVVNNRGTRLMTAQEIITHHCLSIDPEIVKVPGVSPREGGWLEDDKLHFGAYGRADLEPRFDGQVDTWLRKLFGPAYQKACRWIGLALAFERGPICALSITSPPGTGKGMLVKGLVEATDPPKMAEAKNVFQKFEYGLDTSPWIVADEGWASTTAGLANRFRTLVGGGDTSAEKKFAHPASVHVAPRVVLTANNRETVEGLFAASGLTQSDVDAIAQRLFHVDCGGAAAEWLDSSGSYDFTDGWVGRLEGGRKSDYVVARHFLYLHNKHKDDPSMGRFLMQDLTDPALIAWMTVKNPHVATMAEALLRIFMAGQDDDGWVTVGQVQDALRNWDITRTTYEAPLVARHLRMLTEAKDDQRRRKIDRQKLEFYANETGRKLPEKSVA